MRPWGWLMVVGIASGCGDLTVGPLPSGGGEDEGTSGDSSASETLAPSTTVPPSTTTDGTTLIDESSTSSDDSDTGGGFIETTGPICDHEAPPGTEVRCSNCDTWATDCPEGEACRPWANDGGNAWNTTRCSPLPEDPSEVGEPCTMERSPTSGIDSCVLEAMCWGVDAKTLEGECVPFCAGSESDPICPDATACMIANDGALTLCLPTCDPLATSCDDGESCHPVDGTWFCLPDGAGIHGMATLCETGTTAVDPNQLASCDPTEGPCCTPICDPAAPACDAALTCSIIGDSNAGVCVDP